MSERRNITNPADWWAAFETEARRTGYTLSEWIGEAARRRLPPEHPPLSDRRPVGAPKKDADPC